jgi:hypothetical protein
LEEKVLDTAYINKKARFRQKARLNPVLAKTQKKSQVA